MMGEPDIRKIQSRVCSLRRPYFSGASLKKVDEDEYAVIAMMTYIQGDNNES
jgi:hypothetical protein